MIPAPNSLRKQGAQGPRSSSGGPQTELEKSRERAQMDSVNAPHHHHPVQMGLIPSPRAWAEARAKEGGFVPLAVSLLSWASHRFLLLDQALAPWLPLAGNLRLGPNCTTGSWASARSRQTWDSSAPTIACADSP